VVVLTPEIVPVSAVVRGGFDGDVLATMALVQNDEKFSSSFAVFEQEIVIK
jgi:hypothetical protein